MRTLFLVKNIQEAQKALVNFDKKLDKIIAFNLEVEFYLKSKITSYNNPLYKFLDVKGITCNYNFLLPNFEVAYKFAKDENLVGLRDRLGYFFSEFDRSYLFATRVIDKLKLKFYSVIFLNYQLMTSIEEHAGEGPELQDRTSRKQ